MSVEEAARDLELEGFADLNEGERILPNLITLYRQLNDAANKENGNPPTPIEMFGAMAKLRAYQLATAHNHPH